jgi:HD superfamily phosphodiesterase
MVSGSTSEVIKAVDDMLKVITNLPIELQPYPYYTEHFRTHPRNVLRLAFEIMSIKPEIFDEKDVLIITLATLIHDLGQLPPGKGKKKGEPERLKKLFITEKGEKEKLQNF